MSELPGLAQSLIDDTETMVQALADGDWQGAEDIHARRATLLKRLAVADDPPQASVLQDLLQRNLELERLVTERRALAQSALRRLHVARSATSVYRLVGRQAGEDASARSTDHRTRRGSDS